MRSSGPGRSGDGAEDDDRPDALRSRVTRCCDRAAVDPGLGHPADREHGTAPDYGLDVVLGEPRPATVRAALVLARGYGGFNSAMVVRRQPDLHNA